MHLRSMLALGAAALLLFPFAAQAQSFEEALAAAYESNPGLLAQRAALRATNEGVDEALSFYRPDITADGGVGRSHQEIADGGLYAGKGNLSPRDMGVKVKQPVFRGFRTTSAVESARAQTKAAEALVRQAEQKLLFETAQAYLNVLESQAIVELTRAHEKVLREESDATQSRFKVGEVTRTDISQADARLSATSATRTRAEGTLANDQAAFARLIGAPPENLVKPALNLSLPGTLEVALDAAVQNNPSLIAASFSHDAARADITKARGALLPEVNLEGRVGRAWDQDLMIPSRQDDATVMARVSIPLYRTGADYARTRAAQETTVQKKLELDEARRLVREAVLRGWQDWQTAQAAIKSFESERKANELALHGVLEENKVGSRTILDTLNARQELLASEVNLIKAQHDEMIARLALKSAVGELTPEALHVSLQSVTTESAR